MSYTTIEAFVRNEEAGNATTLIVVNKASLAGVVGTLGDLAQRCCTANGFNGEAGQFIGLPATEAGGPVMLAGCNPDDGIHALASLPHRLPEADYRLDLRGVSLDPDQLALGWALAAYRYTRYRKSSRKAARLVLDDAVRDRIADIIEATYLLRDLVNTPTQELGPADLAGVVRALAERFGADYREWVGDDLLRNNYPTIHAVGRAASAARAPRLAMLRHGPKDAPHLVLVGKGVCFDTGGLDLKTADGMRWMKKDMGGAAHAIALAQLEHVDRQLRVTGRDALAHAAELSPDLILDFATLTGAARVALGADLPALFCNRDEIANALLQAGTKTQDPLWRMPLWRPYLILLESHVADPANSGSSRHAGAISAALFLERFVPERFPWCHLDVYSWNDSARPGRPRGGEAQGLRAYIDFLKQRYPA